jgi:hypothetical protein
MSALAIDVRRLDLIIGRADAIKAPSAGGGGRTPHTATVSEAVLAETRARHPDCCCEEIGGYGYHGRITVLRVGMTMRELSELGSGCTDTRHAGNERVHGICTRLDTIRRRYGR